MRTGIKKSIQRAGIIAGILLLIAGTMVPVFADINNPDYSGGEDWSVTFNAAGRELKSSFTKAQYQDVFNQMQPGDDAKVTLKLKNAYGGTVNWYMDNDVLSSLEDDSVADGGIYTYRLTYTGPGAQEMVLFSSDTVGGDYVNSAQVVGLNEVNNSFMSNYDTGNKDRTGAAYFYLGQIASGAEGRITLYVKLDGETQGNDYQNTLAQLAMKFAVELASTTGTPGTPSGGNGTATRTATIVKTGDTSHSILFLILIAAAGALLLILAVFSVKLRRRTQEAEAADEAPGRRREDGR